MSAHRSSARSLMLAILALFFAFTAPVGATTQSGNATIVIQRSHAAPYYILVSPGSDRVLLRSIGKRKSVQIDTGLTKSFFSDLSALKAEGYVFSTMCAGDTQWKVTVRSNNFYLPELDCASSFRGRLVMRDAAKIARASGITTPWFPQFPGAIGY